jgi:NADH:ubiquinone oxidoreductase subunit E
MPLPINTPLNYDRTIKGFESEEQRNKLFRDVLKMIEENKNSTGAPIRILQHAQEMCGYLPLSVLEIISRELNIPLSRLYSILTFYHFFTVVPKGKYVIQVCKGTACYVKGGQKLLDSLKKDFNLEPGGITADGKFSLDMVRCLGCCGLSPVIAVGTDVYRKVKPSQLKEILSNYK